MPTDTNRIERLTQLNDPSTFIARLFLPVFIVRKSLSASRPRRHIGPSVIKFPSRSDFRRIIRQSGNIYIRLR